MGKTAPAGVGTAGPADLVVRGGTLLNVYSEELLEGWGVAVQGGRICAVGPDLSHTIGPETEQVKTGQIVPLLVEAP